MKYILLIIAFIATTKIFAQNTMYSEVQEQEPKKVDNFDFGLSAQIGIENQTIVEGNFYGLGLDYFFNKFYAGASCVVTSVVIPVGSVTVGLIVELVDLMAGYKVWGGGEGVYKGFYALAGLSGALVSVGRLPIGGGAGFTAGLLYKMSHFYATAKYNFTTTTLIGLGAGFKTTLIGLGVGYAF